jgi:hypothetical protein
MCRLLEQVESYAVQVCENVGEPCDATTENYELRHDIAELSARIERCTAEMEALDGTTRPTNIGLLRDELANLGPEIDGQLYEASCHTDAYQAALPDVARLAISDEYALAIGAATERAVSAQCKSDMATTLRLLHKTRGTVASKDNGKRALSERANPDFQRVCGDQTELKMQLTELELQKQLAKTHRRMATRALIGRVEELNDLIQILGGEVVDVEKIQRDVNAQEFEREEEEIRQRELEAKRQANDEITLDVYQARGQGGQRSEARAASKRSK